MKSREKETAVSWPSLSYHGVVSAWAELGGQKAEGVKQKPGGSHSGVQSRMGSWDKVSEQRNSLIEAA